MKYRVLYFFAAMACLWGGSYLIQADFTPGWMTYPIFITGAFVGIPCFVRAVVGGLHGGD